ncbi:hypothetical protein [Streptomyces europaeiscabiei]
MDPGLALDAGPALGIGLALGFGLGDGCEWLRADGGWSRSSPRP